MAAESICKMAPLELQDEHSIKEGVTPRWRSCRITGGEGENRSTAAGDELQTGAAAGDEMQTGAAAVFFRRREGPVREEGTGCGWITMFLGFSSIGLGRIYAAIGISPNVYKFI